MTDHSTRWSQVDSGEDSRGVEVVRATPADSEGVSATDAYEVDDGVVLFDIDNPLAWVEADDAVSLSRMV